MTPNIDATRNNSAQKQLHITSSHGLQSSPLNRLPAEIRNTIWDIVLTNAAGLNFRVDDRDWRGRSSNSSRHPWLSVLNAVHTAAAVSSPQISWALSLMATCRQVRSETKDLLLHLNDINIHVGRIKMTGGRELGLHRSVPVLKVIPRSLGSDNGRVVLCLQQGISEYRSDGMLKDWTVPKLEHILSEFAQTILPFRLFIALDFCFVAWMCGDQQVCGRDVPLTFDDCVSIRGRMPWDDCAAALRTIDETIDRRLSLLRSHGAHRMCAVRAMRRKWESGLEIARRYMQDIVYLIFKVPDDMADVMSPRRVEVKLRALNMRQRRRRGHVVWNSDSEYDDDDDDDSPDEDAEEQDDEGN